MKCSGAIKKRLVKVYASKRTLTAAERRERNSRKRWQAYEVELSGWSLVDRADALLAFA